MPISTPAMLPDPISGHRRLVALDGLRGVAALVVVISHALLVSSLGDAYVGELRGLPSGAPLAWLLANTPLHYLVMGTEAVIIFFILSGLVLTLPMLRGKGLDLWAYYPRRVLRLWLPSAAAMVLAIAIVLLTSQNPAEASSDWTRTFSFPSLSGRQIVDSFLLITGSPELNNPLWSLKWEMLFSLLLPIAFLLVLRLRRFAWGVVVICGLISIIGASIGSLAIKYMPVFLAGCVVAKVVAERGAVRSQHATWSLILGGLAMVGLPDASRVLLPGGGPHLVGAIAGGALTVGAAMIVYGLVGGSWAATLLATRPFRFLGRISFSLYLVHVPILIGVLHLAPEHPNWTLLASVPLVFVSAWLFCYFVEEPSARFARRIGTRTSTARSRVI